MECTVVMGPTYENAKSQNVGIEMLSKQVLIKCLSDLSLFDQFLVFYFYVQFFFSFFKPCSFLHY